MAAFVSARNHCRYCTDVHRATAAHFLGEEAVDAALSSPETALPKLRTAMSFLSDLTASPRNISSSHVVAMRSAGVSDDGIRQVAAICAQFCIINRLADTFGFRLESPKQLAKHAKTLSSRHYKF